MKVVYVTSAGHNLKWDHFEILAKGQYYIQCKIKELKLTLNQYVSSEKLCLH